VEAVDITKAFAPEELHRARAVSEAFPEQNRILRRWFATFDEIKRR